MKNITSNKYFIPGFALVVFLFVALVLVVFRGGVPDDAVATVQGDPIPVQTFNRRLVSYASQTKGEDGSIIVPDPPSFQKCIAAKKKAAKKLSNSALKKQCEQDWDTAKTQVMTFLVQSKWYELEAEDRGINITDKQVTERFTGLKQQNFPKEADYKTFLKESGQTQEDILELVRASMIQEKVQEQVNSAPTPSTSDVEDEYNKNKKKYATPASRDLNLVFNSSKAKADAAKQALADGDSWKAVANEYSQDTASKQNGGAFPGVTKDQFPEPLNAEVFKAKKGTIIGPIKTQYGYYVFEVTKVTEGKQQTLKEAEQQIKQTIQAEKQQTAATEFQENFTEKWRKKTKCAEKYKVPEVCGNAPEPEAGATAEAGGQ